MNKKQNFKVIQINYSDYSGGAARAAYRIHKALLSARVDSTMWVEVSGTGDPTVVGPVTKWQKLVKFLRPRIGDILKNLKKTNSHYKYSYSVIPSSYSKSLNTEDADIVHLHWVQGEMLSISEIGRIQKPLVWTLHDMWAFSGSEHFTDNERFKYGYLASNKPLSISGLDLDRWVWQRKKRHWTKPIHIVAPSEWMANCVRSSNLMNCWPVSVIPNPIDVNFWKPIERKLARDLLNLPIDKKLILFIAMNGVSDPRKGFDLLIEAISLLNDKSEYELIVIGQNNSDVDQLAGLKAHYLGQFYDDVSLKIAYNAADVFALPSRIDNLPNTGVEAHSCGVPIVGFNTSGIPDVVVHKETGYLARAFETEDFARGIEWILESDTRKNVMANKARDRALSLWNPKKIAESYKSLYLQIIDGRDE